LIATQSLASELKTALQARKRQQWKSASQWKHLQSGPQISPMSCGRNNYRQSWNNSGTIPRRLLSPASVGDLLRRFDRSAAGPPLSLDYFSGKQSLVFDNKRTIQHCVICNSVDRRDGTPAHNSIPPRIYHNILTWLRST
jgi:hypothetical protein